MKVTMKNITFVNMLLFVCGLMLSAILAAVFIVLYLFNIVDIHGKYSLIPLGFTTAFSLVITSLYYLGIFITKGRPNNDKRTK